jgi:tRNA A-37 threonylcarbamoyl transferase component Bud32
MARVYRAEHETLRRDVALKVLRPGALAGRDALERFLQEARITAGLQHANIVQVFDVGVHDELPYLAMELLVGEDLDARLRAQKAIDAAALIDIALPVAAALSAVHAAGVVHRDLEPGNIFLARSRDQEIRPKLLDFGIAKATKQDLLRRLAAGERRMGTPLYMAPEVLLGGEATPASDQYSLAVILYECVTGVNPFAAPSVRESVRRIATGKRRRIMDHMIAPSRALADVIERALEVEPQQRFPDLLALGRALLPLAAPRTRVVWEMSFAEAEPRSQRSARRSGRARRSGGRLALSAGLGWLTAALLGGWQLIHRSEHEDEEFVVNGPAATQIQSDRRALRPAPVWQAPAPGVESGAEADALAAAPGAQAPVGLRAPEVASADPRLHEPAAVRAHEAVLHGQPQQAPATLREQPTSPEQLALPDWAIGASSADAGVAPPTAAESEARRQRLPRGTNDAPIFD